MNNKKIHVFMYEKCSSILNRARKKEKFDKTLSKSHVCDVVSWPGE